MRGANRKPEEMREPEHLVADATAVGVMDGAGEVRLMVEQAVDDAGGLAGGRDDHGVERRMSGRDCV